MFRNDWGIKCVGEYLTHKLIKMAKGKIVDENVERKKIIAFKKKREQQSNQRKRVIFEIMLHYSSYITISKTQKS